MTEQKPKTLAKFVGEYSTQRGWTETDPSAMLEFAQAVAEFVVGKIVPPISESTGGDDPYKRGWNYCRYYTLENAKALGLSDRAGEKKGEGG